VISRQIVRVEVRTTEGGRMIQVLRHGRYPVAHCYRWSRRRGNALWSLRSRDYVNFQDYYFIERRFRKQWLPMPGLVPAGS